MSRLIDADALIERLDVDEYGMKLPKAVAGLIKVLLDDTPTVDAVEVVRCKDCKQRYTDTCPTEIISDDGYCSYGERKE